MSTDVSNAFENEIDLFYDFIFSDDSSSLNQPGREDTTQKTFFSGKIEEIVKSFQMALQKNVFPNPFLEKLISIHCGEVFVEISKEDCDFSLKSMAELFWQFALLQRFLSSISLTFYFLQCVSEI